MTTATPTTFHPIDDATEAEIGERADLPGWADEATIDNLDELLLGWEALTLDEVEGFYSVARFDGETVRVTLVDGELRAELIVFSAVENAETARMTSALLSG